MEEAGPNRSTTARQELKRPGRVVANLPDRCTRALEMKIAGKTVESNWLVLMRVLEGFREGPTASIGAAATGYD